MKKITLILILALGVSISSCTKEEVLTPQTRQVVKVDYLKLLMTNSWKYGPLNTWTFPTESQIRDIDNFGTVKTHSYQLYDDSLITTIVTQGRTNITSFPNLHFVNDTLYYTKSGNTYPILVRMR